MFYLSLNEHFIIMHRIYLNNNEPKNIRNNLHLEYKYKQNRLLQTGINTEIQIIGS